MKKTLSLILLLCLLASLFACAKPEPADTSTAPVTETTSEKTDKSSATTATEVPPADLLFDVPSDKIGFTSENDRYALLTDITNGSIIQIDFNKVKSYKDLVKDDKLNPDVIVWRWFGENSNSGMKDKFKNGLDDAKFRWDPVHNCYVVIACSSSGWAGIISYETKQVLQEFRCSNGPHSIELMPNGDFVVACAGAKDDASDGCLRYYPLSCKKMSYLSKPAAEYKFPGCHGVCWNPDFKMLIADGYYNVKAIEVQGYGTSTIKLVGSSRYSTPLSGNMGCHDMVPVPGEKSFYYLCYYNSIVKYNLEKRKFTPTEFSTTNTKGVAPFADGSVVITTGDGIASPRWDWSTRSLHIFYYKNDTDRENGTLTQEIVTTPALEYYKIHSFTANYFA